ncbi:MAG: sugar ABC transporter ATP-binding protein [Anaerolineae bacterium]
MDNQGDSVGMRPILEVHDITKRFTGVVALEGVSVAFNPGEVHAVVGENGAGKSTLMKILAGAYTPDQGEIVFHGERVAFRHPREAQAKGISIIYQEFNLLPERTVAQNIFLGREPSRYGLIDDRALERQTSELLTRLDVAGQTISPQALVSSLSIAQQQLVEIAKALSFDAKVLIMDEPTAALSSTEVQVLYNLIQKLLDQGLAIIFVSHRFKEVFDIAKTITVLKDGHRVGTVNAAETTPSEVIKMMVGRELDHYFPPLAAPEDLGEVALRVRNGGNAFLRDINLELRRGEIVGIAGLQGSGRTELARAIFGVDPFKTGTLEIKGKVVQVKNASQAIGQKMGFVTEDRKAEGLLLRQPVRDNVLLTARTFQHMLARILANGTRKSPQLVPMVAQQVDVRSAGYGQEVQYLSGGNQQKVVLAKWLAATADVLLFDEPTRGIDVEAKASIHDMIRDLARRGVAVLMISSELPEIIGMSDRIAVMWEGTIVGELPARASETEIMVLATGHNGRDISPSSIAADAPVE